MITLKLPSLLALLVFASGLASCEPPKPTARAPIRVAIIGGMTSTGMWQELAAQFERDTGWKTQLVATGPKDVLTAPFRAGQIDLLTMHSSDEATNLVADGHGLGLIPWARNEHILLGPPGDPAGVRGLASGVEALKKIAASQSRFVDFAGPGSREVVHHLWKRAGIQPIGDWVLKDESAAPQSILLYAAQHAAYVVSGRIPFLTGKTPHGNLEIMVEGDPEMRRTYVIVTANPASFPEANVVGAAALRDYLVSDNTRAFLDAFAARQPGGVALFYSLPADSTGKK